MHGLRNMLLSHVLIRIKIYLEDSLTESSTVLLMQHINTGF